MTSTAKHLHKSSSRQVVNHEWPISPYVLLNEVKTFFDKNLM